MTAKKQVNRRRFGVAACIPIRGRPQLPFYADEDRHAVALLHMMLGTSIEGKLPSIRVAAWRAACSKEGRLLDERNQPGAPSPQLAATGRRNSPIPRALKDGYRELEFEHVELRQGGTALENCASIEGGAARGQRRKAGYTRWHGPGPPPCILMLSAASSRTNQPHYAKRLRGP